MHPYVLRRLSVAATTLAVALAGATAKPVGADTILVADTVYTDAATPIAVTAGQLFLIALPMNPGTGYSWRVNAAPNPNVVTMTGSSFLAGKKLMGAPGQEIFVYQARAAGTTRIALDDVAPGTSGAVAKSVHFTVIVKKN
jgi:inhibitor of cysteine peptidase